jgi:hypothetical protein
MNNKGKLMPGGTVAHPGKSDKEHLVGSWILISLSAGDGAKETMPYGPNPKDTRWTPTAVSRSRWCGPICRDLHPTIA